MTLIATQTRIFTEKIHENPHWNMAAANHLRNQRSDISAKFFIFSFYFIKKAHFQGFQ